MERAGPLHLRNSLLLIACLGLAACARSAPELPVDYASVNAQSTLSEADFEQADIEATCNEIAAERTEVTTSYDTLERQITSSREDEQAAGYLSAVLFPPAALAIPQKKEERAQLDEMQSRLDTLTALSRFKDCKQASLTGPAPEPAEIPVGSKEAQ